MRTSHNNATKPKKWNSSKIVDIAKRNLQGELTSTVSINENWSGIVGTAQGGSYYSVKTHSVLSMIAESPLVQKLAQCFDDFKIIDTHLCIDVSQPPEYKVPLHGCIAKCTYEYSTDNGVTWTQISEPNVSLSNCFVDGAAYQTFISRFYPLGVHQFNTDDDPALADNAFLLGNVESMYASSVPIFMVAASSFRAIPKGFYQSYVVGPGLVNEYIEPTFDQLMSYGSCIWQSKMPGASVHLSLDVKGSSNSEKMMTYPTDILNKLSAVSPEQQAGRFCPFIVHGIKVYIHNDHTFYSDLYGSSLFVQLADAVDLTYPQYNSQNLSMFEYTDGLNANCRVKVAIQLSLDGMPAGPDPMYNADSPYGVTWEDAWNKIYNLQEDNLQSVLDNLYYSLSVQGYISVRMKRLRMLPSVTITNYPRIGLTFVNGSSVCFLSDVDISVYQLAIFKGMRYRIIVRRFDQIIDNVDPTNNNTAYNRLISAWNDEPNARLLSLVAVNSYSSTPTNAQHLSICSTVMFNLPASLATMGGISLYAGTDPNGVAARNTITSCVGENGISQFNTVYGFFITKDDGQSVDVDFTVGDFSVRLTRDVSVEENDQLLGINTYRSADDVLQGVSVSNYTLLNATFDSRYRV